MTRNVNQRKKSVFAKDRRRKHHRRQTKVFYVDGEKFAGVYIDPEKAKLFANRQKRSPDGDGNSRNENRMSGVLCRLPSG